MGYEIVRKACNVIFANEGNYGTVNRNDNGAVSVGRLQWHADRAKSLLKAIIKADDKTAQFMLSVDLYENIKSKISWKKRIVDDIEAVQIKNLLLTDMGIIKQDQQAEKDVQGYLNYILKLPCGDLLQENSLIFLADICNQGGSGAVKRIMQNAVHKHYEELSLENICETAITDRVFKNYKQRRLDLYRKLTGKSYKSDAVQYATYEVRRGENLTVIAHKYGTTVKRLVEDNVISDPNMIYAGQILKIYK